MLVPDTKIIEQVFYTDKGREEGRALTRDLLEFTLARPSSRLICRETVWEAHIYAYWEPNFKPPMPALPLHEEHSWKRCLYQLLA